MATVISVPVLAISSRRSAAIKLSALWVVYLIFYLVVSTGMAWFPYYFKTPTHLAVGQEICADSGCFAVDKVEKTDGGSEATYTLFWHLASNDRQQAKHFPGKGLEFYMVDERGRTFKLPPSANQDPAGRDVAGRGDGPPDHDFQYSVGRSQTFPDREIPSLHFPESASWRAFFGAIA